MALLQIAEPGQSTVAHQHRLAAGIDLGTTNSLVATVRSGEAQTLPDVAGRHILPSVVCYCEHSVCVGHEAKERQFEDPLNTISSTKRIIGRSINALEQDIDFRYQLVNNPAIQSTVPRIETRHGEKSPIEISAEILGVLKRRAEINLGGALDGVVITVPAYFDDAQRQATKDAAKLAGLNLYRLLNEPTAAAIAYGLEEQADGIHVVYDLGGGTFDVSILHLNRGVFEVMSTGGDTALGGDDFDRFIANWLAKASALDNRDPENQIKLMMTARDIKEKLTVEESCTVEFNSRKNTLTRDVFDNMIEPLVRKTLISCHRALRDAGIRAEDVNEVVMVGGSTRIPFIRKQVGKLFNREPHVEIDPDRVVALGAAIQANILAGNKPEDELLLLDVTPLSLGIETMGGLVEKIIPRNTTLPVTRAQEFTTFKDGQTSMAIHVVQGERELVSDNSSLARFVLRGLPPMVAGAARVKVTYRVDADGLLSVEAREQTNAVSATIEVKPSYGLTDDEIASMLQDSLSNAVDDVVIRKLRESQVEAARVIEALHRALAEDGDDLLESKERQAIEEELEKLRQINAGSDAKAIEQQVKALEKHCEFYVERRMNKNIRKTLAGRTVESFAKGLPEN